MRGQAIKEGFLKKEATFTLGPERGGRRRQETYSLGSEARRGPVESSPGWREGEGGETGCVVVGGWAL